MSTTSQAPIIGLSVELLEAPFYTGRRRFQLFTDYLDCLREAGGIPILLPSDAPAQEIQRWFEIIDGLLLTGGDDPDLSLLGGPAPLQECKPIPAPQQRVVLDLIAGAQNRRMPLFGVCLGMQLLGISHDAPFEQHLSAADEHTGGKLHQVQAAPASRLAHLVGTQTFEVASFHHQALSAPGKLHACAHSEDGLLEAVEQPEMPFLLGVQWHPERTPDSRASRALFSGFVEAARTYRMERLQSGRTDSVRPPNMNS